MGGPDKTDGGAEISIWDRLIFDHIGPTQVVVEIFYGLIMAMALSNTLRLALIGQPANEVAYVISIAMLGCNFAWGIADGTVNALASHYQNVYYYRLVRKIKEGKDDRDTRELADRVLTEALDEIQVDVLDDDTKWLMGDAIIQSVKRKEIRHPKVGRSHLIAGLWCILLNVLAALPFVLIYQLMTTIDTNVVTLIANSLGAVLLFALGTFLDRHMGRGRTKTGWIMVGLGMFMLLIIIVLGG